MRYRVLIEKGVKQTIASWNLPRNLLTAVYARLTEDLCENPEARLGPVIAPLSARQYQFILEDASRLPHKRWFLFAVEVRGQDVHVIGARMSTDPQGEN